MTITEPDGNVRNVSGLNQLYRIPTVQRTNAWTRNPNKIRENYAYDHKPIENDYYTHTRDS